MKKLVALRKNLKKNNKKGFTLTEIIVVLVILAILAAATIPTMMGMVEQARGKAYIAEARAGYVAAQAIASEAYVTKGSVDDSSITNTTISKYINDTSVNGTFSDWTLDGSKVTKIKYTSGDGKYTVEIDAGTGATVTKN